MQRRNSFFLPLIIFLAILAITAFVLWVVLRRSAAGSFQTTTPSTSPYPILSELTKTLLPSPLPSPTEAVYVQIRNSSTGGYIFEADGQAKVGALEASDLSSQWVLETYQGSTRVFNRSTGKYLSIEHLKGFVEVIGIEPVWMSPRWTIQKDAASGTVTIRNVWHNWEVLYVEPKSDLLRYGRPPADPLVSKWALETPSGKSLADPTSTPQIALATAAQQIGTRGAAVPWVEYEAEAAKTNGQKLGPDRTFGTIASESSGREAIRLDATGRYVEFTAKEKANSIVVRYVIPDSEDGEGATATLSLYVNGKFLRKLNLTSRYAWSYGGEAVTYNKPVVGGAHHFYDEARALVGGIPAGAKVRLQKDGDDAAEYYVVDLIDLEEVASPKEKPAGYLSVVEECGAAPDDGADDAAAIQTCIDRAHAEGTGVWIPAGTFENETAPWLVDEVAIAGAGMWYSILHGIDARFNCIGNGCRYADFAILGETVTRDDQSPENGFNGGAGIGSRLENIWVEHTKVGYWVGPGSTNGLIILNSRFRNLFADGVNFSAGTQNSLVENSHFRNTGDDALASWSSTSSAIVNAGNAFRFNTVQIPWRANCFAIYGGADNRIEDNLCADVVTYPGIYIAQSFGSHLFAGTTNILRNTLIRAGGPMFHQEHGAFKIKAEQGAIQSVFIQDLLIDSATFAGIELEGSYPIKDVTFERVQILRPGTYGIYIRSNVAGNVTFTEVAVQNPGKAGLLNYAPKLYFLLTRGLGNSGW